MPSLVPASIAARSGATPIAVALATASVATAIVACWLGFTALTILPAHDPTHVRLWLGVAAGFMVFALVSLVALRPGALGRAARVVSALLGMVAAGLGLGTIVRVANGRGHFEGYLVLMGLVLAVHGALALLHAFAAPPSAPDPRA